MASGKNSSTKRSIAAQFCRRSSGSAASSMYPNNDPSRNVCRLGCTAGGGALDLTSVSVKEKGGQSAAAVRADLVPRWTIVMRIATPLTTERPAKSQVTNQYRLG